MVAAESVAKPFELGTTGWSARDLDDPAIEAMWEQGPYEIVQGVLVILPPAFLAESAVLLRLLCQLQEHLDRKLAHGTIAPAVDMMIDNMRVARPDAVFLTAEQDDLQRQAARAAGKDPRRARLLISPTLIIESVSEGHEPHDRVVKRRWYAEFGVANYWLLDPRQFCLELLVLQEGAYQQEAIGRADAVLKPSLFPSLELKLAEIWRGKFLRQRRADGST